ncbi:MAG TPA: biotin/lipoyl-binding protein, partial [Fimbriimonas sp.]|nr:biotin/lipoyl-binding protein [Fimbriimonas sp.]
MREKALISSIAIAALIIAGCGKRDEPTAEKPYAATKGDVSITIIEAGTVDAIKTVEIKPQVTGRIVRLLVDEGSRVTSGDLIATIDPQPTELQLEQNMAQLAGAQSQIERTTLEIAQRRRTAQAAVNQAQARV